MQKQTRVQFDFSLIPFVEDDTEYDAVYKVFEAMLEDVEFEN